MLNFLLRFEYAGLVAFLALCGVGLPIPEEAPLVVAGVLSRNDTLEWYYALPSCILGAILGDSLMYAIGRRLGHEWLTRHPTVARFINPDREEQIEHVIKQHGFKVLLLTRFMVGVRGPVYYAAGAAKVPYLRFLFWDLCSASIVVSIVFGLSYRYGNEIAKLIREAEITFSIAVIVSLAVVAFLVYRNQKQRMAKALEEMVAADSSSEDPQAEGQSKAEIVSQHPAGASGRANSNGATTNGSSHPGHAKSDPESTRPSSPSSSS